MKKIMLLFIMFVGVNFALQAQTEMRIVLPNGENHTLILDEDIKLPKDEVVNYYNDNVENSERWSFPVYWWVGNDSGSFTMSGNGGTMCDIINVIAVIFDMNVGC